RQGGPRRDHDRDQGRAALLLRRGLPPAISRQESRRLLRPRRHRRELPDRRRGERAAGSLRADLRRIAGKSAALFVLLLGLGFGSAGVADPLKIRIGMQTPPDKFLTMLAHRTDIVPHVDTSYVLEPVRFAASSEEVTALASGDLDIGNLAYSS